MPFIFLPAASRIAKSWKNGGGTTADVFVSPEGAGLDDFDFRVSIADVAVDGPFSVFAGIERTTAIISGGGFDLDFGNGKTSRLTQKSPPLSYSGDLPATSRLLAGPTRDLNAMSRRGVARHRMERHDLVEPLRVPAATLAVVLSVNGQVVVRAGSAVSELDAFDAVVIRDTPAMLAPQGQATVFVITCTDAN